MKRSILDAIQDQAENTPDRLHLTQPLGGDRVATYTFAQVLDEARRMAAHLDSLGLEPKSNIALVSKNCAHWIIADVAIWLAGHVSVPLYPTLAATTVQAILEHSGSKLLFVGKLDDWESMKAGVPTGLPMIALPLAPKLDIPQWDELIAKQTPNKARVTRDPDDLATIVYTSGTTGVPKGVMHSFRTMSASAEGIIERLSMTKDDRMLSYLPLAHVFERWAVQATTMLVGQQIWFAESLDTFATDLQRARPTTFISVPRLWLKFQQGVFKKLPKEKLERLLSIPIVSYFIKKKVLKALGLDQCRVAGSGSAPIPPDVIHWYRSLGLELLEGYGMSENFCYSHVGVPGRTRDGYVGEPYPGVECKISEEGEILVKSPGTMLGYYKADHLTAEVMTADGFLKTGDRGEIDSAGRLKITGRVKELFKTSKGKYVAPSPIENRLLANQNIEQACVTGAGHPQPHALVVLSETLRADLAAGKAQREPITAELAALRTSINAELDPHEQLDFIVITKEPWLIENGMLTPTLKVKRASLEGVYGPKTDGFYATKQPVIWES
jgi:long-chain acyl-CoA synthetase